MAEGLNKVMLLGNLGADPELKVTQGGQSVLKLRLATTETYLGSQQNPARTHRVASDHFVGAARRSAVEVPLQRRAHFRRGAHSDLNLRKRRRKTLSN